MAAALCGSLLFSTLAYAFRSMSRVVLEEQLVSSGRAANLDAILSARHDLALTSAILRVLSNAVLAILVCYYFTAQLSGPVEVAVLAVMVTTALLLVFSVAVPQAWARHAGELLVARSWPLVRVLYTLLYPLVLPMHWVDEVVRRLSGVSLAEDAQHDAQQTEQEILAVVSEGAAEGAMDEEQKKMIEGVISFRDLSVGQIMTPRTELIGVDVNATLQEVRERIIRDGLSRLPVYDGTLDNIIGVLYAKDLLALVGATGGVAGANGNGASAGGANGSGISGNNFTTVAGRTTADGMNLRQFMRPPMFVPQSKPLRDLLRELRIQQIHMAIVLDEYGGTAGLVTTEDILEEIVGEIADEYEQRGPAEIKRLDPRTVEVDARMNITDLNRELNLQLPENQEFQSVGGFVITTLGSIPDRGATVKHDGVAITVLDSDARRVKRVRLEVLEGADAEAEAMS